MAEHNGGGEEVQGPPLGAGVPGVWQGNGLPLLPPASRQCRQAPASLALSRPLDSPCRRLWSESERKAGRGPPLRKIMASRPRKSAVRPVYSSPPGKQLGDEGPATILPPWHQPAPTLPVPTHIWASPTYIGAGERTAGLMRAPPPPTFNTAGLQVEHVLGEREGRCHLGKWCQRPPQAVALACSWRVGVGEGTLDSGPGQWGRLSHKGAFQAPETSALTQAQWGVFRQPGGNVTAPQPVLGPAPVSPPHGAQPR